MNNLNSSLNYSYYNGCYFLVIQRRTANAIDWAKFITNKYGAAASTMFFMDGPAIYRLDQNITITMF